MSTIIASVTFSLSILKDEAIDANLKIVDFHSNALTEQVTSTFMNLDLTIISLEGFLNLRKNKKVINDYFQDILVSNPYIRSINLLDSNYKVHYSSNEKNEGFILDIDNFYPKPMFDKSMLRFGNSWIGKDFIEAQDAALLKTIDKSSSNFLPILKMITINTKIYYLCINVNSDYFINKYSIDLENNFLSLDVTNINGVLLFSSDKNRKIGLEVSKSDLFYESLATSKSLGIENIDSQKYLAGYRLTDIFPLNVSVRLDFEKAMEKWEEKKAIIILIVTILVLLSITLAITLFYRLSKEKQQLEHFTKKEIEVARKLEIETTRLTLAIEGTKDGLWDFNLKTDELYLSNQYEIMLGYDVGEIDRTTKNLSGLIHPEDRGSATKAAMDYLDTKGEMPYENVFRLRMKDGSWKWILARGKAQFDKNGKPLRFIGFNTDITEQKEYQKKLDHVAKHDLLTQLPNRLLLLELLTHAMQNAKKYKKELALFYVDLDEFEKINDTYGHNVGDQVLSVISSRMKKLVRQSDIVSRIGGDEFIIVITNLNEKIEVIPLLQKFLQNIGNEIVYKNFKLHVSASIGVSLYPQDFDIGNEILIRQADQAMYEAKTSGKNQYKFFNVEASEAIKENQNIISQIYNAIEKDEFVLHYQPKVNMSNNKVVGVEALLRWNHPQKGFLYPDDFLYVIEGQSDIMIRLGEWVLYNAFYQLEQWHKQGYQLSMNINVSSHEVQKENFPLYLQSLFDRFSSIKPNKIEIEILETSAFSNFELTTHILHECQKTGVSIAIDDFGTGYASLHYLKKLPMDTIKIDKSFIMDLLYTRSSLSIIEGSIGLAKAFNTNVIVEGMETEEHGKILLQFGCELAQGYAIAKAMKAENIIDWINSYKGFSSWNNVQSISENERSILYASIDHRSWMHSVEEFINEKNRTLPILDESDCRLGKWIKNNLSLEYFNKQKLLEIDALHSKIHDHVESILLFSNKNKSKEFDIIKNLSEQIIQKLNELERV